MKQGIYVSGAIAILALAYEVHSAAAPANLRDLMKDVVAVQAQVVWDISNEAQDDDGNPDASKLTLGDWAKIADAGEKVRQVAQTCHVKFWYPSRRQRCADPTRGSPAAGAAAT